MNPLQVVAWIQAGQTLLAAGVATANNIRTWIDAQHPGLTDEELNAICDTIHAGATRHKALAALDAAGPLLQP
jgi:hypothetical protein